MHRKVTEHVAVPTEQHKKHHLAGFIATLFAFAVTSGAAAIVFLSLPDIRRYLKISSM